MGLTAFGVSKTLDNMFATQGQTQSSYSSSFDDLWGRYIYIGLFNGDPETAGATEVSGNGYRRVLIGSHFASSSSSSTLIPFVCAFCETGKYEPKTIENVNAISFDYAEGNWGTVTHFGIFGSSSEDPDDKASQHLILSGEFTSPISINQGHIATFKKRSGTTPGAFKISME